MISFQHIIYLADIQPFDYNGQPTMPAKPSHDPKSTASSAYLPNLAVPLASKNGISAGFKGVA